MGENADLSPVRKWIVRELTKLLPGDSSEIRSDNNEILFRDWTGMTQDGCYLPGETSFSRHHHFCKSTFANGLHRRAAWRGGVPFPTARVPNTSRHVPAGASN